MLPIIAMLPGIIKLFEHIAGMAPQIKDAINSSGHLSEAEKTALFNRLDAAAAKVTKIELPTKPVDSQTGAESR